MTNVVYEEKYYNEEVKKEFIKECYPKSPGDLLRLFKISYRLERDFSKDLYNFSREEIRSLMYICRPLKDDNSRKSVYQIKKYIDWAIHEKGYAERFNPLDAVAVPLWAEQFVDRNIKLLWTEEEINSIISGRVKIKLLLH